MIPQNITRESILKVIEEVGLNGIPSERDSIKFVLRYDNKDYPPKYLISIANKYVNAEELPASEFSGGEETNRFLVGLGFEIIKRDEIDLYIIESFSWKVLSSNLAAKEVDKSVFLHHGTGLPKKTRFFFDAEEMKKGEQCEVSLVYKSKTYSGRIEMDKQKSPRTRLFWKTDFASLIRQELPNWYKSFEVGDALNNKQLPNIYFRKDVHKSHTFFVEFIDPDVIYTDIRIDDDESIGSIEGNVRYYYGKRYERDPINRERAIAIHGTTCCACNFNFEKFYGDRGKGYIEIHHNRPLSTLDEEVIINPETDLVPVCSNCHKMIHRYKDKVLGIEEMKEIIQKNK